MWTRNTTITFGDGTNAEADFFDFGCHRKQTESCMTLSADSPCRVEQWLISSIPCPVVSLSLSLSHSLSLSLSRSPSLAAIPTHFRLVSTHNSTRTAGFRHLMVATTVSKVGVGPPRTNKKPEGVAPVRRQATGQLSPKIGDL